MDWSQDDEDFQQQPPTATPQKRQHSDSEASSTKRQATEQSTITYAQVTKPPQANQDNQATNFSTSRQT